MKLTLLVSLILLLPVFSRAQRSMQPIPSPQRPAQPIASPQRPSLPDNPLIPDYIIMRRAPSTNMPNTNAADTNQLGSTNAISAEQSNNIPAATNVISPAMARALGLTNRLSVMAPAQVQAVLLLRDGLDDLQQAAASINGSSGIQQVMRENTQVAQRLQALSARVINLARGPDRPSNDSVDRLSEDLLRAFSGTHLDTDGQLVVSVVINLIVNCQNLPAAQIEFWVNDMAIVLRTAGVPPAVCNAVGCDLNSIALEIRPNLGI